MLLLDIKRVHGHSRRLGPIEAAEWGNVAEWVAWRIGHQRSPAPLHCNNLHYSASFREPNSVLPRCCFCDSSFVHHAATCRGFLSFLENHHAVHLDPDTAPPTPARGPLS